MRFSKRTKTLIIVLPLVVLAGIVFYVMSQQAIVRCYLVGLSDLEEIGPSIYVDPSMHDSRRQALLIAYQEARDRVVTLYGKQTANPVIIAGHTMDVMNKYGGNSYNRVGRTFITLAPAFVILGPDGQKADVIAHELSHAELAEEVGWWNRAEIPSWFDEGLAVQLDDRYPDLKGEGSENPDVRAHEMDQIGVIEYDDYFAYSKAKQEVGHWLDIVGGEGLQFLLSAIRNGNEFQETYSTAERDYSITD